jgi:hypothetical protein
MKIRFLPRWLLLALVLCITVSISFMAGRAMAEQPHMENARDYLQQAQKELQQARANKGGHRVTALDLCSQAINEVNRGIKAGE